MIFRILLAGVIGGAILFGWGALAHMVLQFDASIKGLPNEEQIMSSLKENMLQHGVYAFPYMDPNEPMTEERWDAYVTKYRAGPTGLLIYVPSHDMEPMAPERLAAEGIVCFALAVLTAMLLGQAAPALPSYVLRVFFVFLVGLIAGIAVPLRNLIWWSYPSDYVMLQIAEQAVGFFLAGLAIAAIVRRPAVPPAPTSAPAQPR